MATDDQLREVVRHMADAAPLAPAWDRIGAGRTTPADRRRGSRRTFELVLVAAVAALVVVGLWAAGRPSDEQPADQPPSPTVAAGTLPPPGLEVLDPLDATLCLTQRSAQLVSEHELTALDGADDLPGYDEERAVLFGYRPMMLVWAALASHPDLDPAESAVLTALVDTYRSADASAFSGPEASIGPGFPALVDQVVASVRSYIDGGDDRAICRPQAPSAGAARDEATCLAAARLRRLLTDRGSTGTPEDDALIEAAGAALRLWWDAPPAQVEQLAAALADRLTRAADERDFAPLIDAIVADVLPDGPCVVPPDGQSVVEPIGGQS